MEQVVITLDTGNPAFDEQPATELARILRELADNIESDGQCDRTLRDINGNIVGNVRAEKG